MAKQDLFKNLKLETELKFQIISIIWQIYSLTQKDAEGAYEGKQCYKFRIFEYETETDICVKIWVLSIKVFIRIYFFLVFKVD